MASPTKGFKGLTSKEIVEKSSLILTFGLLAILGAGLFVWDDSFALSAWENSSDGIDELDIKSIAFEPAEEGVIYAGTSKAIFKSSDGGKSWTGLLAAFGIESATNFIAIHLGRPQAIWAATESGVFKSEDSGNQWRRVFRGIGTAENEILCIAISPTEPELIYIGTGAGVFLSSDGGAEWKKCSDGLGIRKVRSIAIDSENPQIIYAGAGAGVYKSMDGGSKWERVLVVGGGVGEAAGEESPEDSETEEVETSTYMAKVVVLDPLRPEVVYVGTGRGVYVSDDSGAHWEQMTNAGLINTDIPSLIFHPEDSDLLYAATAGGVFVYSRISNRWQELYEGMSQRDTRFLAFNSEPPYSLWAATDGGVFKMAFASEEVAEEEVRGSVRVGQEEKQPDVESKEVGTFDISQMQVTDESSWEGVLGAFAHEPTVQEIQQVAISYAEVHPEKIQKWRKEAKQKALIPKLSASIDESKGDYYYGGIWKGKDEDTGWDLSLTWELGDFIWSTEQTSIDVRSKLMVQLRDDILDEVTRLYFERRRLQVEMLISEPKDIKVMCEKQLRLQELAAGIDALTGGYLSRRLKTAEKLRGLDK